MYTLTAQNKSGATIKFNGSTKKEALIKFDSEYARTGWTLKITDENGIQQTIKSTTK